MIKPTLSEYKIDSSCTLFSRFGWACMLLFVYIQIIINLPVAAQSLPSCNIQRNTYAHFVDSIRKKHQRVTSSITVLKNQEQLLPIMDLGGNRIMSISIGLDSTSSAFNNMLCRYTKVDTISLTLGLWYQKKEQLIKLIKQHDLLIVSIHSSATCNDRDIMGWLRTLHTPDKTILALFGSCSKVVNNSILKNIDALLISRGNTPREQEASAQIIFGGISASGVLHEDMGPFSSGSGLKTRGNIRFSYMHPALAGVDSISLYRIIDSVANLGITSRAFPGCQVLVAKDRKIIYHRCFGYHTYLQKTRVKPNDIYDLASLTKIIGTLPALMRFVDKGIINLDERFSNYWKDFKKTNKKDIIIREVLAHQARLTAWIPFWRETVDPSGNFRKDIFRYHPSHRYSVEVAPHMYLNRHYKKNIFKAINSSPLLSKVEYNYSGLPFYIFPEWIRKFAHEKYPEYVTREFYHPLGAYTLGFNARKKFPLTRIVPTEYDDFFRNALLHGFVDDEGCAMMGGISGNAGLFATTEDLAKIMQMYLQMGEYGAHRYISKNTMKEFTRCQFPHNNNRRGLVFDKPTLGNDTLSLESCYPAYGASGESFGHSGFTGTFAWADPTNNLLFIFMSNRVHPSRKNRGIYIHNIRTSIHQGIYDAIERFKKMIIRNENNIPASTSEPIWPDRWLFQRDQYYPKLRP